MTTTKRIAMGAGLVLVLLLAAYLMGFWPERQRRLGAEERLAASEEQVAALDGEVRAARLLGDLLHITDAAAAMNYGVAQQLSSGFFDAAREEAERTPVPALRTALADLVAQRDALTGALARGDPRVVETLREMEVTLREGLGYPTGFRPAPPVAPAEPGPG